MFIYGGNTGNTYESIRRRQRIADELMSGGGRITNVGEGISSAAESIAGALIGRKADRQAGDERKKASDAFTSALTGDYGKPSGNVSYRDAIASVESAGSGDYGALGPVMDSGSYKGDRAYGRYQVMGRNIPEWTKEALGVSMTPDQFLADPKAQDAVFDHHFGKSVQKYGNPQDAASVWFTGRPIAQAGNSSDGYTTAPEYVRKFTAALGGGANPALIEAMNNPWLSDGQKAIAKMVLQQQMQASDPMRQMQLERASLELERMRNPKPDTLFVKGVGLIDSQTGDVIKTFDGTGGDNTEYGLTPQYVTRPDGSLGMVVLGKDGTAKEVDLPEGMALKKGVEKLDLGTHFQWYNNVTGEPIGEPITKDLAGAERQKATGKAAGESEAAAKDALPGAIAKAEEMLNLIQSIHDDPALKGITGMIQGRLPPMTQAGTDLNVRIKQLSGKTFLEAFETLKGGGQITEKEGAEAKAAMARLERAQSTEAYQEALQDLARIVRKGVDRAQKKAGSPASPAFLSGPQGALIPDFSKMTDEELDAYIREHEGR